MGVGGQHHPPAALPPGKTRHPLYRRLGGPQGRSGRVRKISPPNGIRSTDRRARSESLYRLSCLKNKLRKLISSRLQNIDVFNFDLLGLQPGSHPNPPPAPWVCQCIQYLLFAGGTKLFELTVPEHKVFCTVRKHSSITNS